MVGVNEQWLQDHSVMTDKVKALLSLSVWVKSQLPVEKFLCHLRALFSLWLKPNNSKLDYMFNMLKMSLQHLAEVFCSLKRMVNAVI